MAKMILDEEDLLPLKEEDLPPTDGEWELHHRGEWWESKLNGQLHNSLGPAVIHDNGEKAWFFDGELHRLDGPAIECPDGTKEWWVDDVRLRNEDFPSAVISFLLGVDRKTAKLIEQEIEQ